MHVSKIIIKTKQLHIYPKTVICEYFKFIKMEIRLFLPSTAVLNKQTTMTITIKYNRKIQVV
ncbi:hypothetical protein DD595_26315 [Enterobacter cloacae complex sp. 4DZ3-17B2]|nr:hypothetical protein DD595_26315 [Enterobacter cloacae complex sp. 4DZ3-17B2]